MQAQTSKTGCHGCHCDAEQHRSCLNYVFAYGFRQILIRSARRRPIWARLLGSALRIGTLRYLPQWSCGNFRARYITMKHMAKFNYTQYCPWKTLSVVSAVQLWYLWWLHLRLSSTLFAWYRRATVRYHWVCFTTQLGLHLPGALCTVADLFGQWNRL